MTRCAACRNPIGAFDPRPVVVSGSTDVYCCRECVPHWLINPEIIPFGANQLKKKQAEGERSGLLLIFGLVFVILALLVLLVCGVEF